MRYFFFLFLSVLGLVSNASAALTATDVDFAPAIADLGVVFLALIGVSIVIFGYRKILGLLNGR